MIYKMELSDSVDTMVFDLLEVPIVDKDITGIAENTTIDGNVYEDYLWLKKQYVQKWSIMCQDEYDRLRGFWTRQFGNAEVPFYRLFYGSNIYEDKNFLTSDGFTQIMNPTERLAPTSLTHLYGNATQNGTPTPDAPIPVNVVSGAQTVKITGKNLWGGLPTTYSTTSSGVDFITYPDGSVSASGTSTAVAASCSQAPAQQNGLYVVIPKGTYTLSGTNPDMPLQLFDLYSGTILAYTGSPTFTVNGTTTVFIRVRFASGITIDGTTYIQLERGNTATDYEPYQSQSQEINLGKNLLHLANYSAGGVSTTLNSDGTITVSGTTANNYANFMTYQTPMSAPSGTYTFSRTGDNTYRASLTIFNRDKTQNASINIPAGSNSTAAVIPFDIGYVAGAFTNLTVGSNLNFTTGLQLELGSQASSFSPYKTPIELAKIGTYQDYIYKDGGKWYKHAEVGKVVLTGTVGGYNGVSEWFYIGYSNLGIGDGVLDGGVMSDCFIMDAYTHMVANPTIDGLIATSGTHIIIRNLACTDAVTYKTWLSTHNTTVYYVLATPTDTEITDSELIEQLNHIYELYQGANNLWLIGAGAQGEIEGTYRLIYEEETDIVPKTPVVLTLTDGGVINPCGCRQNIQLIMRETEGN